MGNTQSKITSLQILKIKEDSPTKDLLPFIHFITKYNSNEINDKSDITSMVKTWETNNLDLEIIDVRTSKISTVSIPKKNGKNLGISVKLLETAIFMLQMCILDVQNGSPAFTAGLIEKQDYIIGVENVSLLDEDEFFSHLYKNHGKVVVLIVYNLGMKSLRRVEIIPRKEVLLGCEIGSGMLYNIPEDDVMFDWRCDTVRRAFYEQKEKEEIEKHKLETEIEERQENEKEVNDHTIAVQTSDDKTDESRAKESGDKAESIGLPLSDLQIEQKKKDAKNTEPILTEQKVENNANENISNIEDTKEEVKEHDVDNVHSDATKYDTYESECQDNTERQESAAFCNIDCKISMDYEEDAKDNNFGCESIKQVSNVIVCEYPEEENANDNEGITFEHDNKEAATVVDSNYDIGLGDEIAKQENCRTDVHCADSLESANVTDVHASTGLLSNTDMVNKQLYDDSGKPAEIEVTNEPIVDIEQVASGHVNAPVNLDTGENFVDFDDIDENIESATEIQYNDSEDYTEQVTVHSDVFKLTEILNGSDGEPFEFSDDIEQLNKTLTEDQDCNNICNDLKCMAGIDNNVVQGDTSHLFDDDNVEFTLDMPKYDLQNEHASNLTKELKIFDGDLMYAKHPVDVHEDTAASDENATGYTSQKSDCHSDPGVEDYL